MTNSVTTGSASTSRRDRTRAWSARSARATAALTTPPSLGRDVRQDRSCRLPANERAFDPGAGAFLDDLLQARLRRVGDRDSNGVGPGALEDRGELGGRPEHRNAENAPPPQPAVVVDEPDDLLSGRFVELPDQAASPAARADDERAVTLAAVDEGRHRLGERPRSE